MNQNLEKAREILLGSEYTCVLVKGDSIYTSEKRGVAPLLNWIEQGLDLSGFAAADKVVGRGAAMLYAGVLSAEAKAALEDAGVEVYCGELVPRIQNRTKTGYCPMEEAVLGITDPQEAYTAIQRKLEELRG